MFCRPAALLRASLGGRLGTRVRPLARPGRAATAETEDALKRSHTFASKGARPHGRLSPPGEGLLTRASTVSSPEHAARGAGPARSRRASRRRQSVCPRPNARCQLPVMVACAAITGTVAPSRRLARRMIADRAPLRDASLCGKGQSQCALGRGSPDILALCNTRLEIS